MENTTRELKKFKNLSSFSKEIFVECPFCKKKARITRNDAMYAIPYPTNFKAKFTCNNCYKTLSEKFWYGPINLIVDRRCGHCGSQIKERIHRTTKYIEKLKIKCDKCGKERFYDTQYELTYSDKNQATDPFFGLDLWLKTHVKENVFWAYNYDHLNYLELYVSSKLRETGSGGKYNVAWKLPNFIKIAKNRPKILKVIAKLRAT